MSHLSSCCYVEDDNSNGDIIFSFDDNTQIEKIELVEVNKTIQFQSSDARVSLNPADSLSTYRLYYNGGSGVVQLAYRATVKYASKACGEEMQVSYTVSIKNTTFKSATANSSYSPYLYVKIVR